MSTFTNTAREVEMPNGDVVVIHNAPTGGENTTSNIKKFKYDDNGHVTESTAADAEDLNLSGYSTPTTGTTAIGTSDDIQTAIGKLDHQSHIDQTNILLVQDATKELVDESAKNKLRLDLATIKALNPDGTWNGNTFTRDGLTFTINSDMTISASGTASANVSLGLYSTDNTSFDGDMILSGCPDGGDYYTKYSVYIADSQGSTILSTADSNGTLIAANTVFKYMLILVRSGTNVTGLTFKPMITTKAKWDISHEFEPFTLPNYDLTVREAEDRAALVEVIDKGAKNQLTIPDIETLKALNIEAGVTSGTWNGNSFTYKGVTFTINYTDNTITTSGTSTIDHERIVINKFTFKSNNDYVISGCPSGGSYSGYSIAMLNYNNRDTGGGLEVEGDDVTRYLVVYAQNSGTDMSGLTFKPMICTPDEWKISRNHAPYALPNTDLTRMVNDLQKKAVKVYTYHVNPNESDPEDAVTYLDDATGLTPAKMGASSFSYGSWANAWFLPRPCMLKSDGTVAYYLNPNDYSKKTDGTASDIADANFDGNVMLEFPKIWVKRVNDGNGARTVSIAPVNVDGTYKCWSNINAEDKEVDHFYLPAYNGTIHSSKMRSLSGVTLNTTYAPNYTRAQEVTAATANNPTGKNLWYTETWADFCLVYDLLYLMGKSLDVQRTFGQGLSSGSETAMRAYVTGTHNAKGLFYGDISGTSTAVKVLGMENLWGCRWHGVAGLINDNGTLKVKMTYGVADGSTTVGYNTTGSGYLNYGSTYGTNGFVKKMQADNTMGYKIIETAGTDATYYCDYYYTNNGISAYALLGGTSGDGAYCGFYVSLSNGAASASWAVGGSLSCRPES